MVVFLRRNQLSYFRRKALATDKEIFAFLIGQRKSKNEIYISDFLYPELAESTASCCRPDDDDEHEIRNNMNVIGNIHSHPNWVPIMSSMDHWSHKQDKDLLTAIVGVIGRRTYPFFWVTDSSLPCITKFI